MISKIYKLRQTNLRQTNLSQFVYFFREREEIFFKYFSNISGLNKLSSKLEIRGDSTLKKEVLIKSILIFTRKKQILFL
jgi:hypothetical protein